jgi:predicted porin
MRKKVTISAVACALAGPGLARAETVLQNATDTVELYATVYPVVGWIKYGTGNTGPNGTGNSVPSMSKADVGGAGSNWGIRGRRNLNGGWSAWLQIEQNSPLERENTAAVSVGSRNSAAGLQTPFGNVFAGQWTTPWADLESLWNVGTVGIWGPSLLIIGRRETTGGTPSNLGSNCGNFASGGITTPATLCDAVAGQGGVGHPFWRRASSMIRYTSPSLSGVIVDALYQVPETKRVVNTAGAPVEEYNPSMWSTSVQWSGFGGKGRVGAAYDRHKEFTSIGNTDTGWSIKGGWNFGPVDVGAAVEFMKYKCGTTNAPPSASSAPFSACVATGGEVKAKQWGLAAAVPIAQHRIRGAYSKAADLSGPGTAVASDTGASEWNLGYEHRFDPRTTVGLGYARINNKLNANFTWTGMAVQQNGLQNNASPGSSVSWLFANLTYRF